MPHYPPALFCGERQVWQEEQLLLVAYAHQFDRGHRACVAAPTAAAGPLESADSHDSHNLDEFDEFDEFDWRPWAEAADLSELQALLPLRSLAARGLIEYTDPDGHRLRLSPPGVRAAEASPVAEPRLVAYHQTLRRRILAILRWAPEGEDREDGEEDGATVPLPHRCVGEGFGDAAARAGNRNAQCPVRGRTAEQLAADLGVPVAGVLANCFLLHELGYLAGAPAAVCEKPVYGQPLWRAAPGQAPGQAWTQGPA